MDVAADIDDAGLIKGNGWLCLAFVKREVEALSARERVYMMVNLIMIWELDLGPNRVLAEDLGQIVYLFDPGSLCEELLVLLRPMWGSEQRRLPEECRFLARQRPCLLLLQLG